MAFTDMFNSNVARFIFENVELPAHVRQIHISKVAAVPPTASLSDSGVLYVNVSDEHCNSPLLVEAVKGTVK